VKLLAVCALGLAASGPFSSRSPAGERLRWAIIEVDGPLASVRLDAMPAGVVELAGPLTEGEHRVLEVPVPVPSSSTNTGARQPETRVVGGSGRARFVSWSESESATTFAGAVSWPAVPGSSGAVPLPVLLLLLAAFLVGLALRRRPTACALLALMSSGVVTLLMINAEASPPSLRLLELRAAGGGEWHVIDAARDACRASLERPFELVLQPANVPLRVSMPMDLDARASARFEARGATLFVRRPFAPGPHALTRSMNRWGRLDATWVRTADGVWTARGPWELGRPLPEPIEEPLDGGLPPGHLNPALPQGVEILIGRLAPQAFRGPGNGPRQAWVRITSF
jgi:hypothetical protein